MRRRGLCWGSELQRTSLAGAYPEVIEETSITGTSSVRHPSLSSGMFLETRRQVLKTLAAAAGCALTPGVAVFASEPSKLSKEDEAFLDDLKRRDAYSSGSRPAPRPDRFSTVLATI